MNKSNGDIKYHACQYGPLIPRFVHTVAEQVEVVVPPKDEGNTKRGADNEQEDGDRQSFHELLV